MAKTKKASPKKPAAFKTAAKAAAKAAVKKEQPDEGSLPQNAPEKAEASSSKPEKAPKAKAQPEKATQLPAPGKEVWKDVHHQVMKQAKAGDSKLRNAWEKAKAEGSQQAKREFYYHVFLLDPNVSQKQCHKTAWKGSNRLKSLCLDG